MTGYTAGQAGAAAELIRAHVPPIPAGRRCHVCSALGLPTLAAGQIACADLPCESTDTGQVES